MEFKSKMEKAVNVFKAIYKGLHAILSLLLIAVTGYGILLGASAASEYIDQTVSQEVNQEIVTLQPRDGDVIIKDGDSYKMVQLIKMEDINASPFIQKKEGSLDAERVELFKTDSTEDWSEEKGYQYTLEEFSINPDKIMNLISNIDSINLYFDFYSNNDITSKVNFEDDDQFKVNIYGDKTENDITNTSRLNLQSEKAYVTPHVIFGVKGVKYIKLRVVVNYTIKTNDSDTQKVRTELLTDYLDVK